MRLSFLETLVSLTRVFLVTDRNSIFRRTANVMTLKMYVCMYERYSFDDKQAISRVKKIALRSLKMTFGSVRINANYARMMYLSQRECERDT